MSYLTEKETFVECPYDSNHKVQAFRLQAHLIRCKKLHPEMSRVLETCPFNALHKFLKSERDQHLSECVDKQRIMPYFKSQSEEIKCDLSVPDYVKPDERKTRNEEYWEEEDIDEVDTYDDRKFDDDQESTLTVERIKKFGDKVEKNEIMKKFEQKNERGIYSAMGRGVLHRFNNNNKK